MTYNYNVMSTSKKIKLNISRVSTGESYVGPIRINNWDRAN